MTALLGEREDRLKPSPRSNDSTLSLWRGPLPGAVAPGLRDGPAVQLFLLPDARRRGRRGHGGRRGYRSGTRGALQLQVQHPHRRTFLLLTLRYRHPAAAPIRSQPARRQCGMPRWRQPVRLPRGTGYGWSPSPRRYRETGTACRHIAVRSRRLTSCALGWSTTDQPSGGDSVAARRRPHSSSKPPPLSHSIAQNC